MCECGYHASRHVFDAMVNAPGPILSRVECKEITDECDDKLVCRRRRVIATIDATKILRKFARLCALDVVHLWEAPDIVIRYLKTGDESIRDAAMAAARDVVGDAVMDAAWSAALAAARSIGRDAAMDAARAAARAIGRDAALRRQRVRLARMVNQAFKKGEES